MAIFVAALMLTATLTLITDTENPAPQTALGAESPYWLDHRAVDYSVVPDTGGKELTITNEAEFALFMWEQDHGVIYDAWTVVLTADLDLSAYQWISVSMSGVSFDGQGHKIAGLLITEAALYGVGDLTGNNYEVGFAGLFGAIENCTVCDLVIESPVINIDSGADIDAETNYIGVIAGVADGSQIREVYIFDPTVILSSRYYDPWYCSIGNAFIGGVVGGSGNDTIINGAEVYGGTVSVDAYMWEYYDDNTYEWGSAIYLGGISGANYDSIIANAAVYGTLISAVLETYNETPIYSFNMGGITGYTSAVSIPDIGYVCVINCISTAKFNTSMNSNEITAEYGVYLGGIAGFVNEDNAVNNVYIDTGENVGCTVDIFGCVVKGDFDVSYNYIVSDGRTETWAFDDWDEDPVQFNYNDIIERLNGDGFDLAVTLTAANMGKTEEWVRENGILKKWVFLPEGDNYDEDTPGLVMSPDADDPAGETPGDDDPSEGMPIALIIGVVAVLVIAGFCVYWFVIRKK